MAADLSPSLERDDRVSSARDVDANSSTTFLYTFDKDIHYPLFTHLCDHLTSISVINLAKTCRQFSSLYRDLLPSQWNIGKSLCRFVGDPDKFRAILGDYDALISGSFVIQFLERVSFENSDLDIFINSEVNTGELYRYLTESENYNEVPVQRQTAYVNNFLTHVQHFVRINHEGEIVNDIQVIKTRCSPLRAIICGFWSTAVVNFMTWNKAYSIYPWSTFMQRRNYLMEKPQGAGYDYTSMIEKYEQRGWFTKTEIETEDVRHPIHGYRRVGDRHTWIIPLDTSNITTIEKPDTVLEFSSFHVSRKEKANEAISTDEPDAFITRAHDSTYAPALKHQYTVANDIQMVWIQKRADQAIRLEFLRDDVPIRPEEISRLLGDLEAPSHLRENLRNFIPPDTWEYHDKEYPVWYREWEQEWEGARARAMNVLILAEASV